MMPVYFSSRLNRWERVKGSISDTNNTLVLLNKKI